MSIVKEYLQRGYEIRTYYGRGKLLHHGDPCPKCGSPVRGLHMITDKYDAEVTYYHVCDNCRIIWKWNTRDAWYRI